MYINGIQIKILNHKKDINYGTVYENAVAQELRAHGLELYYFNSRKQGELDFLIERNGEILPIEIKSGKNYTRHAALTSVMANPDYAIPEAYVFQNDNVRQNNILSDLYAYVFGKRQAE